MNVLERYAEARDALAKKVLEVADELHKARFSHWGADRLKNPPSDNFKDEPVFIKEIHYCGERFVELHVLDENYYVDSLDVRAEFLVNEEALLAELERRRQESLATLQDMQRSEAADAADKEQRERELLAKLKAKYE